MKQVNIPLKVVDKHLNTGPFSLKILKKKAYMKKKAYKKKKAYM